MKMTAAVLEQCGQPLRLLELDVPKLQRGQVLVRVAYSAICRSQLMEINGLRGPDKWLPHLLGHEASGVVVDVGADVTKVRPGDKVILTWIESSGIESKNPQYHHQGQVINAGPVTTLSNYSIVSENRVVLKPSELDMEVAALFGCALATGSGMALNELDIEKNQSVLVLGLGGVGMSALLTLLAIGVKNVFAADRAKARCELAAKFGASTVLFESGSELEVAMTQILPRGFDYCIEAGGSTKSIELGFSLLHADSGKLLFASHPPAGQKIELDPHHLIRGKSIKGSWGGQINPDEDIPVLTEIFAKNKTDLRELTKDKFTLQEINTAVSLFDKGTVFRPIITMEHNLEML